MESMTTAEATVATLIAHGIDYDLCAAGRPQRSSVRCAFKASATALRVVHTRHEQGAAYMALGAALATGKPQAYAVVPGPGLLNSSAALLTAYGMNAPVLALIGQIPAAAIGASLGHLHEIRDQAGIIARLVDHSPRIRGPGRTAAWSRKRSSPCATAVQDRPRLNAPSMSGASAGPSPPLCRPRLSATAAIDDDAGARCGEAARAQAKRALIVCGGGAQDASPEVTLLSAMLQAPVLGYRRGRGVLDSRNPLSVTLPLGHELWGEADVVLAVGTRLFIQLDAMGHRRGICRSFASTLIRRSPPGCTSQMWRWSATQHRFAASHRRTRQTQRASRVTY